MSVVKIGFTSGAPGYSTVHGRLGNHQTSNWRDLVVIAMAPGSLSDEQNLHHEFDHYCVRGEWFLNHGEVAAWLKRWSVEPIGLLRKRMGPRASRPALPPRRSKRTARPARVVRLVDSDHPFKRAADGLLVKSV